ncbi:hypothetical protein MYX06_02605 [Patescibacteria group bacterium AH-259-L05]|nr:hypothetical protein [Patescibacteria group bacterium AH-259-L05]
MKQESIEKEVFEMQIDAIVRGIVLIGKDAKITIDDVFDALANAEKDAQFLCGFEMLNDAEEVKKQLADHLIVHGFVTIDDEGYVSLTAKGLERSKKKLPSEIERCL